jgi:hypothetical protein
MQQSCTANVHEQPLTKLSLQLGLHLLCRMHAEPASPQLQGTFALQDVTVTPHFTASPAHTSSRAGPAAGHLALHIGETTIQLPFSPAQAQQLDAELAKLLQTFADKQAAKRPKR